MFPNPADVVAAANQAFVTIGAFLLGMLGFWVVFKIVRHGLWAEGESRASTGLDGNGKDAHGNQYFEDGTWIDRDGNHYDGAGQKLNGRDIHSSADGRWHAED